MSTPEFLAKLSKSQLRRCIELAKERLKGIEKEEKFTLFILNDGFVNIAAFREEDFDKALDALCEKIKSCGVASDTFKCDMPSLHKMMVHESEVPDWMSLNK